VCGGEKKLQDFRAASTPTAAALVNALETANKPRHADCVLQGVDCCHRDAEIIILAITATGTLISILGTGLAAAGVRFQNTAYFVVQATRSGEGGGDAC